PRFATRTFKDWFAGRPVRNPEGRRVLLWPDTFVNHFHPQVGKATVEVLEAAGCRVVVPEASLCCGRPLYDYGMLDLAERQLTRILKALRPEIRAGTPLIGMEPSCLAVFRDELPSLFPRDADARRLSEQSFVLSEFLETQLQGWQPPKLGRKALVQVHCHHHAVMKFDAEKKVLDKLGLDYEQLQSGCCGMAGSFGFEAGDKYDVSVKAGERVLFPKVRDASPGTLILADGFSCRTQIEQGTGRTALHLAEVIRMALRGSGELGLEKPEL
ncbi:MAG TPA: heterodisulfide reductase-related iron-sulfur binding cluster, partial [Actinomycetota bacterium]